MAWTFPTGDAVTATPTVVNGTVYVGSWDGWFYALDLETGALRWKYQLQAQHGVTPYPGQQPRDSTSDGGLVTSSAWFEPGAPTSPADRTGPTRPCDLRRRLHPLRPRRPHRRAVLEARLHGPPRAAPRPRP